MTDTNKYSVSVLDYDQFFELIYGNGGMPKDKTVYDRIRYFGSHDFGGMERNNIKPYYTVMLDGKKVIGIAKIGFYKLES